MLIKVCFCFKLGKEIDVVSYFFDFVKVINYVMLILKELRYNQEEFIDLIYLNFKRYYVVWLFQGIILLGIGQFISVYIWLI